MQLIIKNFGPLKTGQIDLTKKFYVFVGYNNSGKTYVSELLWCLFHKDTMEWFASKFSHLLEGFIVQEGHGEQENHSVELTPVLLDSLLENFAQFLKTEVLPEKLKIDNHSAVIGERFSLVFQYDLEKIRQQVVEKRVNLIDKSVWQLKVAKPKDSMTITVTTTEITPSPVGWVKGQPEENASRIPELFVGFILRLIFGVSGQFYHTFFLPASRTFLSDFYYYVLKIDREEQKKWSQQLLEHLEQQQTVGNGVQLHAFAVTNINKRPYNQTVSDLVEKINALLWEFEPTPYYAALVAEMNNILGGKIEVEKAAGMGAPVISFQMSKRGQQPLPMYLSSSAVNQLAPLSLYFQYWAKKDQNFLFIDEPEENLHPHNQIALCNVLLKFALYQNNRVLISTHSPLIAENINNYLSLNRLKERYGLVAEDILTENQLQLRADLMVSSEEVGIYFFNGQEMMNYEANDYGVYFRDFREVSRQVERAGKILANYIYMKTHEPEEEANVVFEEE